MGGITKPVAWMMTGFMVVSESACGAETVSEPDRKVLSEACQALKANVKKTACMEVVGRLGQTKQPAQVVQAKAEQPVRELIMLKGVPFDTPGSSEAIMNLCLSPGGTYYTPEKIRQEDYLCKFQKNGRIMMPDFEYGNLRDTVAWATVDKDGALIHFEKQGSKGEMRELASLLSEKYGKPKVIDSQTENKMGTKFDKTTFIWVDERGTRIVIESIFDKIDSGRVVIDSASTVKLIEAVEKLQKESEKGKL